MWLWPGARGCVTVLSAGPCNLCDLGRPRRSFLYRLIGHEGVLTGCAGLQSGTYKAQVSEKSDLSVTHSVSDLGVYCTATGCDAHATHTKTNILIKHEKKGDLFRNSAD